jgi:hypothetical protein
MDEPVPHLRPQAPQQQAPQHNLPVVVQPDPMLDERGGTLRTIALSLGMLAVVMLALYGITRPDTSQQMAGAPSPAAQVQPASGSAQAPKPEPSTTGQGQSGEQQPKAQ